ncbi:enoyl-CoA hydratase/isomerase family protein [uncultured Serinicoccus sp.]|uniref:enoyl-CoA hydratase/isomerase family protein n=1 Tax=uncultured Serinicoccus sp. TaxID=735514 RepID=UPI00261543DE|nr:enoyl-CoA hydratase/isomerase family protein [uncultured Serinicoccus sp.]
MTTSSTPTATESEASTVLLESRDGVSWVTLNRPERLNAIDLDTHLLLNTTLQQADVDPDTRVIVLTGAGRGFCAGGDVKGMEGKSSFGTSSMQVHSPGRHLINTMVSLEKPVIAMVNGVAVGLGATIALMADVVIMAEEAKIGDRHVNVGLVAGDGGAVIWPLLIGLSRAKEMLMTGRMLTGPEAASIGLISRAVPQERLQHEVTELAEELAGLPPYAVRATKLSVNRLLSAVQGTALDVSLAYEHLSMKTADHQEAISAWREGRPGVYTGK